MRSMLASRTTGRLGAGCGLAPGCLLRVYAQPKRQSAPGFPGPDTGELLVARDVPAFVQTRFTSRTGELLRLTLGVDGRPRSSPFAVVKPVTSRRDDQASPLK